MKGLGAVLGGTARAGDGCNGGGALRAIALATDFAKLTEICSIKSDLTNAFDVPLASASVGTIRFKIDSACASQTVHTYVVFSFHR